jgi:uncharacterized repeat protein (TIGR01451 family)
VASITEITGGTLSRYPGSQSLPNYIGTGLGYDIWGAATGWDGIIEIDLASPTNKVGLGVADSQGDIGDVLSVYDGEGNLLEEHTLTTGLNIYPVITRDAYEISRIRISGDFFSADDLQFNKSLEIVKTLEEEDIDDEDGDGLIEVGELVTFTMTINVTNVSGSEMTDVVVTDGIGGDLTLVSVEGVSVGPGPGTKKKKDNEVTLAAPADDVTVSWSGKTQKAHLTWSVGTLGIGASDSLTIVVATDINPGQTPKDDPVQEFTSAEEDHELNTACATGMLGDAEVYSVSNTILIDIVEPVE